jgi:hypothetical protein
MDAMTLQRGLLPCRQCFHLHGLSPRLFTGALPALS